MSETRNPADEETFDRILDGLRQVVERLESGGLSLEDSLAAFEEGVRLSRRGARILDLAERRVEVLLRGEAATADAPEIVPFAGENA